MQKREAPKSAAGGAGGTPAKRGRPVGSHNTGAASASASATTAAGGAYGMSAAFGAGAGATASSSAGPSLHVLADQNNKRIVLALQSGIKSELTWALNALMVLSFKEKDDMRRDAFHFAKVPGLLDAVLQVVDDRHPIGSAKDSMESVGGGSSGYKTPGSSRNMDSTDVKNVSSDSLKLDGSYLKKSDMSVTWFDEDGLFDMDAEAQVEKLQYAVAASNIVRNFSFMPEKAAVMVQNRHCMETIFQCLKDFKTEDEEIVTNMIETAVNLSPVLDLRIFSNSQSSNSKMDEKCAVRVIVGMLGSSVRAWHCPAAESIGRLIVNPDNEPLILPSIPEIYKRLVDLMNARDLDSRAAAVGALYSMSETNVECRLKLATERWAIDRLIKIIKAPHPVPDVCRKAAMTLESLISEPQNRPLFLAYERSFVEILTADSRCSDTIARLLYDLTAKPSRKASTMQPTWGNMS